MNSISSRIAFLASSSSSSSAAARSSLLVSSVGRSSSLSWTTARVRSFRLAAPPTRVSSSSSTSSSSIWKEGLPYETSVLKNPYAPMGHWLGGVALAVAGMVHVGGLTRLTQSGLSMTDWKPWGGLPPLSRQEWEEEFARYQTFPEFSQRSQMTLSEFQWIYAWEYGHRMMGRTIGVLFVVPALYFAGSAKHPPLPFPRRLVLLGSMGAAQGLVGWWMVQSGLGDDRRGDSREIRVSPYRLATHLGMALATYSLLVWSTLDMLQLSPASQQRLTQLSQAAAAQAAAAEAAASRGSPSGRWKWRRPLSLSPGKLRSCILVWSAMAGWTAVSGAFVAGNDAGRAYNVFPHMTGTGDWIPPAEELWPLTPTWRNWFESTALVQCHHRWAGLSTATTGLLLAILGRAAGTRQTQRGCMALASAAVGQATLGILTLLHYVPLPLAALHQLGSLLLLTTGIYTLHTLRYAAQSPPPRRVATAMAAASASAARRGATYAGTTKTTTTTTTGNASSGTTTMTTMTPLSSHTRLSPPWKFPTWNPPKHNK